MKRPPDYTRAAVAQQFHRARRQAAMEDLLARISGHSSSLLSYEQVVDALQVRSQSSVGMKQVPVSAIVGSVGRYNDFSRTFLPLQDSDEDRWVSVRMAASHVGDLPPVELYQIGEFYFVMDGNHRVSIARQQDVEFIDARVTVVHTRVPFPPDGDPDALIAAAEYAGFLEWTHLDQLREGVDLRVSVPAQYFHLENHIEAFRFVMESAEDKDIELPVAAAHWYDEAYMPMVEAIREQGILRYFPGRTETDFFVWLATHQIELQNELGLTLTPETAVSRLLPQLSIPETV
ncbi:MAG: universal stress protein, partial [Chloroflexota bacterium]